MLEPEEDLDELVDHVSKLEWRVKELEGENGKLRSWVLDNSRQERRELARYVDQAVPQTNIISPNFFKRAFAVWGHFVITNVIIGVTIAIVYFVLVGTSLGPTLVRLLQR
jgi:hypothetical protein